MSDEEQDERPDSSVTPELFRQWQSPRFGRSNPERMSNPVWEWLVRSGISAWSANEHFKGRSAFEAGPGWCFSRFGQSSTQLPDGRTVLIAGEHEDHYDPDFYIYNDVVVRDPAGGITIYGYPREAFPPTDFHSGTLVGNRIIIIGSLGYPDDRRPGDTPVMALDLETFAVSSVVTSGTSPGWIHSHCADLAEDGSSILIRQGKLDRGIGEPLVENIDDWRLNFSDWRWERLTERQWQRWEVKRKDGKLYHLREIQMASRTRDLSIHDIFREEMERLTQACGQPPDLDLAAVLYRPDLPHEMLPEVEDEYGVFRIRVDGIVVRYVEEMRSIQMTVEGDLPQTTIDSLTSDVLGKMSTLEHAPCALRRL